MRATGWTEAHWRLARGLQSAWPSQAHPGRAHVGLGWAWLFTETRAALPNGGNFILRPLGRPDKAQGALPSRGGSQDQQGRRSQGSLGARPAAGRMGRGLRAGPFRAQPPRPPWLPGMLPRSEGFGSQHLCGSGSMFCPSTLPISLVLLRALSAERTPS